MGKTTANAEDVLLAIAEGRLNVRDDGTIIGRGPHPRSKWTRRSWNPVFAPHAKTPYFSCSFSSSRGNFCCLVHRVVWFAHRGEIPSGLTINHINGIKSDNRLDNLELLTNREQQLHAKELGLANHGVPKNWSLDDSRVREIRRRIAGGEKQAEIARDMRTSTNVVNRIARGRTYQSVT